jgi:hypothetical protein
MKSLATIRMLCVVGLIWTWALNSVQAQYRAGDVVSTNFGFVNRYRWTNDNGQVFAPNSIFRLSEFDDKIVFFIFFDSW